jgi:recombination protein RecT
LSIRERLDSASFKAEIAKILPRHLTPERMARVAITAIMRTPLLAECDQASFFQAMMQLSQWGLEPDGRRAHLIPFRNNKRGVTEVQLIIDYKGLVELIRRSGDVTSIRSETVCENDVFEWRNGAVDHRIEWRSPRGDVQAVYAEAKLSGGEVQTAVLTRDEVEAIRKRSRAGGNGPWVTDWAEMAKKTAVRRLSKMLPLSAEVQDAMLGDDDVLDVASRPARSRGDDTLALPPAMSKSEQMAQRLRGHADDTDEESDEPAVEEDTSEPPAAKPKTTGQPASSVPIELESACADAYENGDLAAFANLDERWFGPDANWTEDPREFKAARDLFEQFRDKLTSSPSVKATRKEQTSMI